MSPERDILCRYTFVSLAPGAALTTGIARKAGGDPGQSSNKAAEFIVRHPRKIIAAQ